MKRVRKKWTVQENNILKKIVLEHPETISKQVHKAADALSRSYMSCISQYHKLSKEDPLFEEQIMASNRRSRVLSKKEVAFYKNPKLAARLRQLIKENPGNLLQAFRTAGKEFDIGFNEIRMAYYGTYHCKSLKDNLLYRFHSDNKLFFLLGRKSGYNMKNFNEGHRLTSNKLKKVIKALFPRFK